MQHPREHLQYDYEVLVWRFRAGVCEQGAWPSHFVTSVCASWVQCLLAEVAFSWGFLDQVRSSGGLLVSGNCSVF